MNVQHMSWRSVCEARSNVQHRTSNEKQKKQRSEVRTVEPLNREPLNFEP